MWKATWLNLILRGQTYSSGVYSLYADSSSCGILLLTVSCGRWRQIFKKNVNDQQVCNCSRRLILLFVQAKQQLKPRSMRRHQLTSQYQPEQRSSSLVKRTQGPGSDGTSNTGWPKFHFRFTTDIMSTPVSRGESQSTQIGLIGMNWLSEMWELMILECIRVTNSIKLKGVSTLLYLLRVRWSIQSCP